VSRKQLTLERYEEIRESIRKGLGVRAITRKMRCSRRLVREIRDGLRTLPAQPKPAKDPLWSDQVAWAEVIEQISLGSSLKDAWKNTVEPLTTYSNFWKRFQAKFPQLRRVAALSRLVEPGDRVEVSFASYALMWVEASTSRTRSAYVFVSALGFSQFLFAHAVSDLSMRSWLTCHRRMFDYYSGAARHTVPGSLRGFNVTCRFITPRIDSRYVELAARYSTTIVPAKPKGTHRRGSLISRLERMLMRYVHICRGDRVFASLTDLNATLRTCVSRINSRPHIRWGLPRQVRFERVEKAALVKLPRHHRLPP
jgi:transposase